jgi:Mg2+ and Co2+ transporter CorA
MNAPMTDNNNDKEAAQRVAERVRQTSTGTRTWYEVRALMQDFAIDRFTADAQERMSGALAGAGIAVEPDLRRLERRDTVFLSWSTGDGSGQDLARTVSPTTMADAVTLRIAHPGGAVSRVRFPGSATQMQTAVRWFDIQRAKQLECPDLYRQLERFCVGLTDEMVADLVSLDPRPKMVQYDHGRIRALSTFTVRAVESDDGAPISSHSKAGLLIFNPVEILVGPQWVITCWHETQIFRAGQRINELPAAPPSDVYAAVERSWGTEYSTSGDLAVLLLLQLAMTYKPACRHLYVWAEEWELDYFRTNHAYEDTLLEMPGSVALLRDWLSPLNISGMRHDITRAWFPGLSGSATVGGQVIALRVDDRVDQSLAQLHEVSRLVRDGYQLLEVRRLKKAQDRDARFQRTIAIGGSAILLPTLVAGIMGSNTWVPGEYRTGSGRWAFGVLVFVMVITAILAWWALRRMHPRED